MDKPAFSVIIPVYNGEKFIAAALDSVAEQTFRSFEIVIVNDGSPDGSEAVIEQYRRDHPEIKIVYLKQKNKGLGGARNTAIRNASGRIISLLDQDDAWYPEKLRRVNEIFADPGITLVCHDEDVCGQAIKPRVARYGPNSQDIFRELLFKGNCLSTSATSFRKEMIEAVGFFSEETNRVHFTEDYDLWFRAAKGGCRFYFLHEVLGKYFIHSGNFSSLNEEMMLKHTMNVLDSQFADYAGKRSFDWFRINRHKGRLCLSTAFRILKSGNWGKGLQYAAGGVWLDPLCWAGLPGKLINKMHNVHS
ncbi:MAG: glycosyltransferase [Candidatus Margulisiibacteriota bacterium]